LPEPRGRKEDGERRKGRTTTKLKRGDERGTDNYLSRKGGEEAQPSEGVKKRVREKESGRKSAPWGGQPFPEEEEKEKSPSRRKKKTAEPLLGSKMRKRRQSPVCCLGGRGAEKLMGSQETFGRLVQPVYGGGSRPKKERGAAITGQGNGRNVGDVLITQGEKNGTNKREREREKRRIRIVRTKKKQKLGIKGFSVQGIGFEG